MKSKLVIVPEPKDVYALLARDIANEITLATQENRALKLILPIGPTAQYPLLAQICNAEGISFKSVYISLMDEYLDWQGRPIPTSHPLSFRGAFQEFLALLNPVLRPQDSQWIVPDPFDINRVEQFFKEHGGVDVCYGGVGVHGHIAFNEPPVSRYGEISLEEFAASKTRVIALAPETFVINALRSAGGKFSDFPSMAVTIGMELILSSAKIRLYCDGGTRQNEAIYQFVGGPVSVKYPITLLQNHHDTLLTADELSASKAKVVN
jgi:glucosamine-6-phosphate deaminase